MQISQTRRREACLHLIQSRFDVDGTIAWFLTTYADDPAVEAAKDKEKFARNLITMGGSGLNQIVNIIAFHQALMEHEDENVRRHTSVAEAKSTALTGDVTRERDRNHDLQRELTSVQRRLEESNRHLKESEIRFLTSGTEAVVAAIG